MFSLRRRKKRRSYGDTPRHVLIKQVLIGSALVIGIVLIGAGVWYGTRIDVLTIRTVSVTGGETVTHEEVCRIAEAELAGSYFKLIPYRFAWTYPEESIEAAIMKEERIKEVSVERTSGTELAISFTEYRPAALWCESVEDTACLFLDETGYAFGHAPELLGAAFLRYSDPTRPPAIGEHAFDVALSEQIITFADTLDTQHGFTVFHVEQSAPDEITYHIAGGGMLKTSEALPLEDALKNLNTILTSSEFEHLAPGNFEYIDLRYGDKVFVYEETLATQNETAASSTEAAE